MAFGSLWLPVIVSAVAVWFASALAWMALPHHKSDYTGFPDEPGVADAFRKQKVQPGTYVIPYFPDMKGRGTPEGKKRFEDGPVAMVTVVPNGPPAMGKSLAFYFVYCFFVSFLTAYVARHTLSPTTAHPLVLRITGACAVGFYALGNVPDSIWMGRPWNATVKSVIDSIAYGLITGLIFMVLWPK